jgi:TetR/AcrR family transcriptional regulator, transcriptional repressor for nem operon
MARYGKDRKGETRQRIIELAAQRFRSEGVDGVGIASLMAEAGLTSGGFYAHFASKEDLVKEAVLFALASMPAVESGSLAEEARDLRKFVDAYLSPLHRDHPERGCAVAAMAPDLTRRPPESRSAFNAEGLAIIEHIASALPAGIEGEERRARALSVFSHLLGTLQMARFVTDKALSTKILARGREEALRLAGL